MGWFCATLATWRAVFPSLFVCTTLAECDSSAWTISSRPLQGRPDQLRPALEGAAASRLCWMVAAIRVRTCGCSFYSDGGHMDFCGPGAVARRQLTWDSPPGTSTVQFNSFSIGGGSRTVAPVDKSNGNIALGWNDFTRISSAARSS
eukprot:scaffold54498_cov63-Phaeocystis_antarctica.AAC.4